MPSKTSIEDHIVTKTTRVVIKAIIRSQLRSYHRDFTVQDFVLHISFYDKITEKSEDTFCMGLNNLLPLSVLTI